MRSYFTTTGYQHLTSDTDFSLQERTSSSWGAHDEYTFDRLYEMLESRPADRLWHTGFLTLSSHEPFEVPYNRLKDKRQNSFAYTDHCLGEFIDRLKQLPVWNNLLVICLPDHGSSPTFNVTSPTFYHIPMLWLGGAIKAPAVIHTLMEPKRHARHTARTTWFCHIKTSNTAAISFRHPTPIPSLTPRSATDSCSRTVPV